MGGCRSLGLLGLGAALLCLPGTLRGQSESQTYRLPIPAAAVPSTIELSVAYPAGGGSVKATHGTATLGDWDVTVGVDLERCEILCVYRRVRYGTHLMPPVAEIRIYTDSLYKPIAITVDPAGIRLPIAIAHARLIPERVSLPGRRAFIAVLVHKDDPATLSTSPPYPCSCDGPADVTLAAAVSLRI